VLSEKQDRLPDSDIRSDIEQGVRDARFSNIEAIAKALGLALELTETAT